MLGASVASDPAATEHVRQIRAQVRESIAAIRQIAHNLRPPVLDDLGLRSALQGLTERYNADGFMMELDAPRELPSLSAAAELAIYRIVEEALTNVVRHARAGRCRVRLRVDETIELWISDDGVGLPDLPTPGVGLISMRERAEELGGRLVAESTAERGTRILVTLPASRGR